MARRFRVSRMPSESGLSMASLMDMMTILLVFLLTNYGTNVLPVQPSDDFQLPASVSGIVPEVRTSVVVTQREVFVDGERILSLEEGSDGPVLPAEVREGRLVKPVYETLVRRVAAEKTAAGGPEGDAFEGEVLFQMDRRIPFSLVRDVMFTAGQAGFGKFKFVVVKRSE